MLDIFTSRRARSSHGGGQRPKRPGVRLQVLQLEDRLAPAVNLSSSFPAMMYSNTPGYVPPDTCAASGPSSVIETVNTDIAIYDKSGTSILKDSGGNSVRFLDLPTFFKSVGGGNVNQSDPGVVYDELLGKFFVWVWDYTANGANVTSNRLLYAVSNTSSPTSASDFTCYQVGLTSNDHSSGGPFWGDFPRVGWNASEFAVTFNMFTANATGNQNFDHVLVVNISTANPSTTTVVDFPGGNTLFTVVPAVMHGDPNTDPASDPMYFVEDTLSVTNNTSSSTIMVLTETNFFTTPTFPPPHTVNVDPYQEPPAITQQGSSNQITANDSGILEAEWRGGHLVAAQSIGVNGDAQAHARWYEFDVTTSTPTFIQDGTIGLDSASEAAKANSWFPSISIGFNDVLALDYMEASPTEYMSMWVTGRLPTDTLGTMETPVLAQAGLAPYGASFDTSPLRSGDYSAITVDPNDGSFWAANEFALAPTLNSATVVAGGSLSHRTTYFYLVTAITPGGETGPSNEKSARIASTGSNRTIALSWTAVPGATGYKIYRGTFTGSENRLVATINSGTTTSFNDTGGTTTAATPPAADWGTAIAHFNVGNNRLIENFDSSQVYTLALGYPGFAPSQTASHEGGVDYGMINFPGPAWIYRADAAAQVQKGDSIFVWLQFTSSVSGEVASFAFGATSLPTSYANQTYAVAVTPGPSGVGSALVIETQTFTGTPTTTPLATTTTGNATLNGNQWYLLEVDWSTSGKINSELFDSNGTTLLDSAQTKQPGPLNAPGGIGFNATGPNPVYWDTVTAISQPSVNTFVAVGPGPGAGGAPALDSAVARFLSSLSPAGLEAFWHAVDSYFASHDLAPPPSDAASFAQALAAYLAQQNSAGHDALIHDAESGGMGQVAAAEIPPDPLRLAGG
jgi:hypothetical protein